VENSVVEQQDLVFVAWLMTYDDLYYVTICNLCIPVYIPLYTYNYLYLCHLTSMSIYVNFIQFPQRSMKISDSLTLWFSSLMESLGKSGIQKSSKVLTTCWSPS
jgi:hypothetical protein